jgi:hypothetical protein
MAIGPRACAGTLSSGRATGVTSRVPGREPLRRREACRPRLGRAPPARSAWRRAASPARPWLPAASRAAGAVQPSDPDRHIAEPRPERHRVVAHRSWPRPTPTHDRSDGKGTPAKSSSQWKRVPNVRFYPLRRFLYQPFGWSANPYLPCKLSSDPIPHQALSTSPINSPRP